MRANRPGIHWLAFLLVLVAPLLFWHQWLLPKQNVLNTMQHEIDRLRTEAHSAGYAEQAFSPQIPLAEIMQRLGTPEQLPERVERLHGLLRDYGVTLLKASYKLAPGGASGIGRYEILLDVEGPYYGVRLFSRAMLLQDETIALESLDLHRQPGGGGRIRSTMRWVMFVKGAGQ